MTRVSLFSSPLLLGFDDIERLMERASKASAEGYPPYNIERLPRPGGGTALRITLAVAGFSRHNLEIAVEDNQLSVKGRIADDSGREFLHRGIAGRQFQRSFILADGVDVVDAALSDGLLTINLELPEPKATVKRIEIKD